MTRTVHTRDGRALAVAEYGDPGGRPVMFFQGTPSSRLWRHPDESIAARAGARMIRIDRPGFGLSDFHAGRTLLHWPSDVARVADALGVGRFAVIGVSGGGPYAAACAFALPERVTAVAIAGGAGPIEGPGAAGDATARMTAIRKLGLLGARHAPWAVRVALELIGPRRDAARFFERFTAGFPARDRALLADRALREVLIASYAEAVRRGSRGFAHEIGLFARPWGFDPAAIRVPVFLWHGEDDTSTPIAMARALAAVIPGCATRFLPGEGHFVVIDHYADILADVLGEARA